MEKKLRQLQIKSDKVRAKHAVFAISIVKDKDVKKIKNSNKEMLQLIIQNSDTLKKEPVEMYLASSVVDFFAVGEKLKVRLCLAKYKNELNKKMPEMTLSLNDVSFRVFVTDLAYKTPSNPEVAFGRDYGTLEKFEVTPSGDVKGQQTLAVLSENESVDDEDQHSLSENESESVDDEDQHSLSENESESVDDEDQHSLSENESESVDDEVQPSLPANESERVNNPPSLSPNENQTVHSQPSLPANENQTVHNQPSLPANENQTVHNQPSLPANENQTVHNQSSLPVFSAKQSPVNERHNKTDHKIGNISSYSHELSELKVKIILLTIKLKEQNNQIQVLKAKIQGARDPEKETKKRKIDNISESFNMDLHLDSIFNVLKKVKLNSVVESKEIKIGIKLRM